MNPNPLIGKKKFDELPEDVQEAMSSVDTTRIMKEISEKHHLHIDQAGALTDDVGDLMLGDSAPSQFIGKIKKDVRVDEKTAREIAEEVNRQIFKPIRESLKGMYHVGPAKEVGGQSNPVGAALANEPKEKVRVVSKAVTDKDSEENSAKKPPVPPIQQTKQKSVTSDPYRESVEDDDSF